MFPVFELIPLVRALSEVAPGKLAVLIEHDPGLVDVGDHIIVGDFFLVFRIEVLRRHRQNGLLGLTLCGGAEIQREVRR